MGEFLATWALYLGAVLAAIALLEGLVGILRRVLGESVCAVGCGVTAVLLIGLVAWVTT